MLKIGRNFITTLVSLSTIIMILLLIIKDCDASIHVASNGTMAAEGLQGFVEEETVEFLMDTHEHQRILVTTYSDSLAQGYYSKIDYKALDRAKCVDNDCSGKMAPYNVNKARCIDVNGHCK